MYREKLRQLVKEYEKEIVSLKSNLVPSKIDNFYAAQNGSTYKWLIRKNGQRKVIKKKDREFAERLAYQKYLTYRIHDLEEELSHIRQYLATISLSEGKSAKFLEHPEYRRLISPFMQTSDEYVADWLSQPFETNPLTQDIPFLLCSSGNKVRSKSELLIDEALSRHKCAFRYECKLMIDGSILYPDFTILRSSDRKIIYWEHFGMMDNLNYSRKACDKLHLYTRNGLVPDINLITTFETSKHPLDAEMIERKIKQFLL